MFQKFFRNYYQALKLPIRIFYSTGPLIFSGNFFEQILFGLDGFFFQSGVRSGKKVKGALKVGPNDLFMKRKLLTTTLSDETQPSPNSANLYITLFSQKVLTSEWQPRGLVKLLMASMKGPGSGGEARGG